MKEHSWIVDDERYVEGVIDLDGNNIVEFELTTESGTTDIIVKFDGEEYDMLEELNSLMGFDKFVVFKNIVSFVNKNGYNLEL
tara:strand:+ start:620 stop:868 length:249 start_codon:yes stop_codon:yes gene_type:complete